MKKAIFVFLWLCALLVPPAGVQAGSITGRVTGPWGVFPLVGILVQSYDATAGVWGSSWALTAANGTYVLEDLAAGTWRVRFTDTNDFYLSEVYDNVLSAFFEYGTNIEVPSVGTVSNINATLYGCPIVTGRVTRKDGTTPLANVWVLLFWKKDSEYNKYGPISSTDTNGNYKIDYYLWPGIYRVVFMDQSGIYMPEIYDDIPGTDYENYGTAIELVANHTTEVSASLSLPSTIAGTVTGPDGATPMPGVRVTAYREIGTNWISMASSLTDDGGGYEV
ncbi:MAG: carboxypeptidase-like regulatory domain-containing protein, partial [Kiritimatiellae bacterium]|nr:carboxypeptidase-like regulatory domain-containing protein [Kiritimatiellia bacterium]